MHTVMRLSRFILVGASLLATLAGRAQLSRGAPAPESPLPERLDLQRALAFAFDNNFAIRQAKERIRQQEGVVIEAKARSIPNAAIASSYTSLDKKLVPVPIPGFPVNTQTWSIGLNITQNIFAGGGVRSAIKSSKLTREAAMFDLENTINDALLAVRTAFYNVLLTREQIRVQESNLELLQEQLKNTAGRFEAGTVSSFEKLRAEVAVANAKPPLITARNNHRLAIESLRQALGFVTAGPGAPHAEPEVVGTLAFTPATFDLPAALEAARGNRPDLRRLVKLVAAREQDVRTARAAYLPTLAVTGSYQFKNFPYAPIARFNSENAGWTIGVQSNWAIFDGRATAGRVREARSAVEQSKLTLADAQLAAEVNVRTAFSRWQEATELAEASKLVVGQAEEAVRLADTRYKVGAGTQLDLLQAQTDLTTARTNQYQAYYNYNVAVATLRRAMGLTDEIPPVQGESR